MKTVLRPGQILRSKTGSRVVYVRTEARAIAVGESGRRVLMVPVNGGEEVIVVRTLFPVRDNQGRWLPGQELNGRYSQADLDAGVLTPTDDFATDDVPQQDPRPTTKRATKRKEAVAMSDQKQDPTPAGEQAAAPDGGTDAPVTVKERKPRKPREPKAPKPDMGPTEKVVIRIVGTPEEIARIRAAAGDGSLAAYAKPLLLAGAPAGK